MALMDTNIPIRNHPFCFKVFSMADRDHYYLLEVHRTIAYVCISMYLYNSMKLMTTITICICNCNNIMCTYTHTIYLWCVLYICMYVVLFKHMHVGKLRMHSIICMCCVWFASIYSVGCDNRCITSFYKLISLCTLWIKSLQWNRIGTMFVQSYMEELKAISIPKQWLSSSQRLFV